MGFVSEQGTIWKDQVSIVRGGTSWTVFLGRFWKREYHEIGDPWPVRWVRNAREATRFLRLDGIEFAEMTIWSLA
jgi:hypothetical protein